MRSNELATWFSVLLQGLLLGTRSTPFNTKHLFKWVGPISPVTDKFRIVYLTDGLTQFIWKICQIVCQIKYLKLESNRWNGLNLLYVSMFILHGWCESRELCNVSRHIITVLTGTLQASSPRRCSTATARRAPRPRWRRCWRCRRSPRGPRAAACSGCWRSWRAPSFTC